MSIRCDQKGCSGEATYMCVCARCVREQDWNERYHTCFTHHMSVFEAHRTVRGYGAQWLLMTQQYTTANSHRKPLSGAEPVESTVETLRTGIVEALRTAAATNVTSEVDPPATTYGSWWINVSCSGRSVVIEYRPSQKTKLFGISLRREKPGQGHDMVCETAADAASRALSLLLGRVHVVLRGRAPCGTVSGVPSLWPAGHMHVSSQQRDLATCPGCSTTKPKPGDDR